MEHHVSASERTTPGSPGDLSDLYETGIVRAEVQALFLVSGQRVRKVFDTWVHPDQVAHGVSCRILEFIDGKFRVERSEWDLDLVEGVTLYHPGRVETLSSEKTRTLFLH